MMTDHAKAETAAVARLAALKCPPCEGKGLLHDAVLEWDTESAIGRPQIPPCVNCSGTGLRFSGLMRKCPCPRALFLLKQGGPLFSEPVCFECQDNYDAHDDWCGNCHGTGSLAVSPAEALYWLMEQEEFDHLVNMHDRSSKPWQAEWSNDARWSTTPLLAIAAAIEAPNATAD